LEKNLEKQYIGYFPMIIIKDGTTVAFTIIYSKKFLMTQVLKLKAKGWWIN
jgi:hypothetical protein